MGVNQEVYGTKGSCEVKSNSPIHTTAIVDRKQTERIVVFTMSARATQTMEEHGKQSESISLFTTVTEVKSHTKDHNLLWQLTQRQLSEQSLPSR